MNNNKEPDVQKRAEEHYSKREVGLPKTGNRKNHDYKVVALWRDMSEIVECFGQSKEEPVVWEARGQR